MNLYSRLTYDAWPMAPQRCLSCHLKVRKQNVNAVLFGLYLAVHYRTDDKVGLNDI